MVEQEGQKRMRDRTLGVDYVERSPGTVEAVALIAEKLGSRSRAEAMRDAACFLAEQLRNAPDAEIDNIRKRVLHARAEFGVR